MVYIGIRDLLAVVRLFRPERWRVEPLTLAAHKSGRTVLLGGTAMHPFIVEIGRELLARSDRLIVGSDSENQAYDQFGDNVVDVRSPAEVASYEAIDAVLQAPDFDAPASLSEAVRACALKAQQVATRKFAALIWRVESLPVPIVVMLSSTLASLIQSQPGLVGSGTQTS